MDSATTSGAKKTTKKPAAVKLPKVNDRAKPMETDESSVNVENDRQVASKGSSVGAGRKAPNDPFMVDLIMEMIMSKLPLKDLKTARLVCQSWNTYATQAIEKRSYAVNFPNSGRIVQYTKTMKKNPMLLFSKFCLKNKFSARIQTHLRKHGPSMKTLYIEVDRGLTKVVNFQNVIVILSSTPNLEHLSLKKIDFQWNTNNGLLDVNELIPNIELSKLITIRLSSCFTKAFQFIGMQDQLGPRSRRLEWIEKLFQSAPNLNTLELDIMPFSGTLEFWRFARIFEGLGNLKHLSLKRSIRSTDLEALLAAGAQMKLESLRFEFYAEADLQRLSEFLTYDSLKTLDIGISTYNTSKSTLDVYVPALKNLREMTLRYHFQKRSGCRAIRYTQNVQMRLPKLKTLNVYGANCSILESIFQDFHYIEQLRICSFSEAQCTNINKVLSGLPDPERISKSLELFKTKAFQVEIDAFIKLTLMAADPSLRDLRSLKRLEICSGNGEAQVTDLTADFVLLKIQPLESLKLTNVQFSKATREALVDYHHIVMFS